MTGELLHVRDLCIAFEGPRGSVTAVDGVDLALGPGETLALVGESGCGKTLTALAVMGCLPEGARVVAGRIALRGRDLLALPARERRALCGKELAMSFQEPLSALNPVLTIGEQVAESLRHHAGLSRAAARQRSVELLVEVGLPEAAERARRYPHELSGGQRQRALLAIALACGPALLIADEPTSALDASVQAEILQLLAELRARHAMALWLITHDLAVVAECAERVAVMYAGRIVEQCGVVELFERPAHPYTVGLLRSRPASVRRGERFPAIPGTVPLAGRWPSGCRFRPRCALADERCAHDEPPLAPVPRARPAAGPAPAPEPLHRPDAALEVSEHRSACHYAAEAQRA